MHFVVSCEISKVVSSAQTEPELHGTKFRGKDRKLFAGGSALDSFEND